MKTIFFVPTSGVENWKQFLAEPEKQWKDGYSAKELAKSWEGSCGFPKDIKDALNKSGHFKDLELLLAFPEYQVALDNEKAPSQNDIWMLARTKEALVSIAVEGKVAESFGPTLEKWLSTPSDGKINRLSFLKDKLELESDISPDIRYQLLHRTASAIIQAEKFHAKHAVMIVHSFYPDQLWIDDYKKFISLYKLNTETSDIQSVRLKSGILLSFMWVSSEQSHE